MQLVTTEKLFQWAQKNGTALCAFNVNSSDGIIAVTEAANEMNRPIILQASKGAIEYLGGATKSVDNGLTYITALVNAASKCTRVPIAMHLDHGDEQTCYKCIDAGFTSVMIDGSKFPFEENIAVTKRVVDYAKAYAKKHNCVIPSVEGELGKIEGIEDDVKVKKSESSYTDPAQTEEFVKRTGVTSLAVSIGTKHGAHKFSSHNQQLRTDILAEIQKRIPNTPLVLHGASSSIPECVRLINENGGTIGDPIGTPEEKLAETIPLGVRKINIDSDFQLASTAATRKFLFDKTGLTKDKDGSQKRLSAIYDPRQINGFARNAMKEVGKRKLRYFTKELTKEDLECFEKKTSCTTSRQQVPLHDVVIVSSNS